MLFRREGAGVYLVDKVLRGPPQKSVGVGVAFDKAQRRPRGYPGQVMPDKDLTVAAGPRADPDGGDR